LILLYVFCHRSGCASRRIKALKAGFIPTDRA
jgi:hypothetical protein